MSAQKSPLSSKIGRPRHLPPLYLPKLLLTLLILLTTLNLTTSTTPEKEMTTNATVIPEPEIYKQITAIKIRSIKILHKMLNETDSPTFTYFYTKTSKNSLIGAEMIKMVSEKLDFMINFVLIDCEDFEPYDYKYCVKDPEAKDGYPRMVVYAQPEYRRKPYT